MKLFKRLSYFLAAFLFLSSCGVSKYATLSSKPDLSGYKFVYITPTSEKTSVSGDSFGNKYGVFGATSSTSISPAEIISGRFIKNGFVRIPELTESFKPQTIVVNISETGRKNYGLAYSIEVTLQLLNAATYDVICNISAEGMGDTEADDVRIAITKCLDALFQ